MTLQEKKIRGYIVTALSGLFFGLWQRNAFAGLFVCGPVLWEFDRTYGYEIDEYLGWGIKLPDGAIHTGSFIEVGHNDKATLRDDSPGTEQLQGEKREVSE